MTRPPARSPVLRDERELHVWSFAKEVAAFFNVPLGPGLTVPQPTMVAMGALDDWTLVARCQALFDRIATGRELLETHVYPRAHHSFDALGLPVRYLAGVGNRSKPGGCCCAHYGANEAAWKAFVEDVKAFLTRTLPL